MLDESDHQESIALTHTRSSILVYNKIPYNRASPWVCLIIREDIQLGSHVTKPRNSRSMFKLIILVYGKQIGIGPKIGL